MVVCPWGSFLVVFLICFLPLHGGVAGFLFAVFAAVDFLFLISQYEDMGEFLFDGSDAAGVFAFDYVVDFPGEHQFFLIDNLPVLDDVDGDIVIDKSQNIQIQRVDVTLYFQDVLLAHFVASGVLDDGYRAVQLIQF